MADGVGESTIIPLSEFSELQKERLAYSVPVPSAFADAKAVRADAGETCGARSSVDQAALESWFPNTLSQPIVHLSAGSATAASAVSRKLRVGVCFNGRQAPGGHNVIAGLHDQLKALNPESELLGFVGGSRGLFAGRTLTITDEVLGLFRQQGGYHLLGRSVDKIRSEKEQAAALATANALALDGLLLIGGTFTNTDAAHLAEYFAAHQAHAAVKTAVIGCPVTIDGDLSNEFVEATLGFDTATKTFAQLVGNMATDSNSAKKYWYSIRLMGRAYGHIALEVALRTHPNLVLIGEDIAERKVTLRDIVREVADLVESRAAAGKNFGVLLVPEGTIMAIPETRTLLEEMNAIFRENPTVDPATVPGRLTPWSAAVLAYLPPLIRQQLFLERESSGAVQLSQISTERMIADLVGDELARRKAAGGFKGGKYAAITHAFGYQGRSPLPSNFDAAYGSALGRTAAVLIDAGRNGYMATVRNLAKPTAEWTPLGVPLAAMCTVPTPGSVHERAYTAPTAAGGAGTGGAASSSTVVHSGVRPVIESAPVNIGGCAYAEWKKSAPSWSHEELYANPGPIQFSGKTADTCSVTLSLDKHDYLERIMALRTKLDGVRELCKPGVSEAVLDSALTGVTSLLHILETIKRREQ